jgi:beta-lactamase superfamily II metal-dependent hydrolase
MRDEDQPIGSLVGSDSEAIDWFAALSPKEQELRMSQIKANALKNKTQSSRMFFQEIDGKLKVIGVEGDLAKPKE